MTSGVHHVKILSVHGAGTSKDDADRVATSDHHQGFHPSVPTRAFSRSAERKVVALNRLSKVVMNSRRMRSIDFAFDKHNLSKREPFASMIDLARECVLLRTERENRKEIYSFLLTP